MSENDLFDKVNTMAINKTMPHIIHGDIAVKGGYPTHTHGLWDVGLPELFINATAFGPKDNAVVLNVVFVYLGTHKEDFYRVQRGELVEFSPWEGTVLCIRPVQATFAGVRMAYVIEEEAEKVFSLSVELKRMFAQVYVKGDDYVLEDSYYADSERGDPVMECVLCKSKE